MASRWNSMRIGLSTCMQVAADGGCERDVVHRMTEWYRGWGALKSVLLH